MLVLTRMLLAPFRGCFYRHASLLSGPLQPAQRVVADRPGGLPAGSGQHPAARASAAEQCLVGGRACRREVPNSLRLTVALAVVLALIAHLAAGAARPGALAAVGRSGAAAAGAAGRARYRRPRPTAW